MGAGRIDEIHGIVPQDSTARGDRPRPPAHPPVGGGQKGGVASSYGEVSLDLEKSSTDNADVARDLLLELWIGHLVRVSLEREYGDPPSESPQIARVLESSQYPAAATLGRIVVGNEERVLHEDDA
jgi:hypothetical protein